MWQRQKKNTEISTTSDTTTADLTVADKEDLYSSLNSEQLDTVKTFEKECEALTGKVVREKTTSNVTRNGWDYICWFDDLTNTDAEQKYSDTELAKNPNVGVYRALTDKDKKLQERCGTINKSLSGVKSGERFRANIGENRQRACEINIVP